MLILRPGQRILQIPGYGVQTSRRAVASGAADWWAVTGKTCAAAYQPKGAASYAASKVNLANPGTYDALNGTAYPTWDSVNGWKFNQGNLQWLETGITPVNNQTWSGIALFSNLSGATGTLFGIVQACRFAITVSAIAYVYQNGSYQGISGSITSGTMAIAGNQGYKNGTADGATIPSAGGSFTNTIAIGRTKETGYEFYLNGYIQALVIYSDTLTAGEVATVSAAMAAL